VKVVTTHEKQKKFKCQGKSCVYVAYPPNHAYDFYYMFYTVTNQMIKFSYIIWLRCDYGTWNLGNQVSRDEVFKDDDKEESMGVSSEESNIKEH
jgi:hypothetical protein